MSFPPSANWLLPFPAPTFGTVYHHTCHCCDVVVVNTVRDVYGEKVIETTTTATTTPCPDKTTTTGEIIHYLCC